MMSKEQQKALTVVLQNLNHMESKLKYSECIRKNGALLPTDFMAASREPILKTNIPRESYWSWNQSNARISYHVNERTTITFRKVSTKKDVEYLSNVPSGKIWLYDISTMWEPTYYFLWCERGVTPTGSHSGIKTEIGVIFPDQLSAQCLSFLRPYVDEELAVELGWF